MRIQTNDTFDRADAPDHAMSDGERTYRKALRRCFIISASLGFVCLMGLLLVANVSSAAWWLKSLCDLMALMLYVPVCSQSARLGLSLILRATDPGTVRQAGKAADIRSDRRREETRESRPASKDRKLCGLTDGLAQIAARQLAKRQARKTRHDSRHAVTKGTAAADAHEFPGTRTYRNLDVLRRDLGMATGHEIPDDVQSITRTAIRLTGHAPIIRTDPQGKEVIVQQWGPDNK